MLEFNCEQEDVVRIPISLKFVMDDMYENLIVPARSARTLTKLIQDLLQLYYENEYVRDLIERPDEVESACMADYDVIMQQINNLLASQKEAADRTMILETQIGGMNSYLEQQQEILSGGLDGGLDGGIDAFMRETSNNTASKPLAITVNDTKPSVAERVIPVTELVDTATENIADTDDIADISDDYSDIEDATVDEEAETDVDTAAAKQHTNKIPMHSAVKKQNGVNLNPALMKLVSGMEKL